MSPRGYYTKESLHPHFTTKAYKESDAYKNEVAMEIAIENWFKGLIHLPRKIAMKVWVWMVWYFGPSRNEKKD